MCHFLSITKKQNELLICLFKLIQELALKFKIKYIGLVLVRGASARNLFEYKIPKNIKKKRKINLASIEAHNIVFQYFFGIPFDCLLGPNCVMFKKLC